MRKKIFFTIISFFSIVCAFSQSFSETRKIKTTAIEVYEKYTSIMANLYNGDVYNLDNFLLLFDTNATIYNDILPANKTQLLSPQAYFDTFTRHIKMNYSDYHNLDLEFPILKNDKWEVKCVFGKDIEFKTEDNYYPKWTFDYTVTIEMDTVYNQTYKIYDNAKIKSIVVTEPLEDFFIIQNKDSLQLMYHSEIIEFGGKNNPNNSKVFSGKDYKKITVDKNEIFRSLKYIQNRSDKHIYDVKIRKRNLISLGINYSPMNFGNNISKPNLENFTDIEQKYNALAFSLLYGLQLAYKPKSTWFFNIRLDLNWHNYIYQGNYYTQYQSVDSDNDPYLRKININSLTEKINNWSMPLSLSFQYLTPLSNPNKKSIFLSVEIGGFADYILFSNHKYNFNAGYSGYYEQYFSGIEFNHYYDYGHFNINDNNKLSSVKDLKYDYGVFGAIGLWVALNNNSLLKLDVSYRHSFNSPLKYKEDYVISENQNTYESLLQSTKQGLQNIYIGISFVTLIKVKSTTQ